MSNGVEADSVKTFGGSSTSGSAENEGTVAGTDSQFKKAVADLVGGVLSYHVWAAPYSDPSG